VPGLLRTSDARDVLTGLRGADEVRRGFRLLTEVFGGRLDGVIVQPVVTGGVEVTISVLHEQVAGPLVLFGTDGATDDAQADRAARLAPLTDADAGDLIRSVRAAPRLLGRRGARPADLAALRDMLLRVSRMVDDLPQIAELELSPVIARPTASRPSTAASVSRRLSPSTPTCAGCHDAPASGAGSVPAPLPSAWPSALPGQQRPAIALIPVG
jgi:acyl-CoA synthetase (NDP forming)